MGSSFECLKLKHPYRIDHVEVFSVVFSDRDPITTNLESSVSFRLIHRYKGPLWIYFGTVGASTLSSRIHLIAGVDTGGVDSHASAFITFVGIINAVRQFYLRSQR